MSELNANEFYVDEEPSPLQELVVEDEPPISHIIIVEEEPKQMPEVGEYVPGSNTLLVSEDEEEKEEQEAKDKDWEHDQDHSKFLPHFDGKIKNIPRHSGQTVLGCERAIAFLKSLLTELSKALRGDLEGKIDEQAAEDRYKDTQNMIERLEHQIKKLKGNHKGAELDLRLVSEGHCATCNSVAPMWHDTIDEKVVCLRCDAGQKEQLEKSAATPKINVYVSAFERAVVGTLLNSSVSAGRNIEDVYDKLKNKYNFTPREELAIQQLIADYGYPMFKDRGRLNENSDPSDGNGVDFSTNYYA
jgi:hypothetical protein